MSHYNFPMTLSNLLDVLHSKGITVEKDVRIKGLSGVYHEFNAVLNGKVGVLIANENISQEDSLRIVLKKMDTGLRIIVISENPISGSQKYILEEMGIDIVEGNDWEKISEVIMLILRQLDQGR